MSRHSDRASSNSQTITFTAFWFFVAGVSAFCVIVALALSASAGVHGQGSSGSKLISETRRAEGGTSVQLFAVPANKQLVLTQACVEHVSMYVAIGRGLELDRVSFNGEGCTSFEPGFTLSGGTSVRCVNKSGQARNCAVIGILGDASGPATAANDSAKKKGAKFYDVDAELRK